MPDSPRPAREPDGRPASAGDDASPSRGEAAPHGEPASQASTHSGSVAADGPKARDAGPLDDGGRKGRKRRRRRQRGRHGGSQAASRDGGAIGRPTTPDAGQAEPSPPGNRVPDKPERNGGEQRAAPRLYAALDLGTNNCRLLVATPARAGQFRVVDSFSRIVRLGEGLSQSGSLSSSAMDRAIDALAVCAGKVGQRTIRRQRLIATEACRSALNGNEFLDRVRAETGLDLEIVSRETEARLAVAGCASLVERDVPAVVVFDIGGGSTEIALCDLTDRRGARLDTHIKAWTSLPVGVVSLAEKFGGRDVTPALYEAMVAHVAAMIADFDGRDALGALVGHDRFHLLGTSGTVTTIGGLYLKLDRYDRRRIDGLWIDNSAMDTTIAELITWPFEARVANVCIGPDRADLVLPGCAILDAIRRQWPSNRLRIADRGLREGLLTQLMATDGAWRRGNHRRRPGRRPAGEG